MENENKSKNYKSFFIDSTVTVCDVLLFSSAVNCLFQLLAYGRTFDIALFIISLVLGLIVYYFAMNIKRTPKVERRLIIAVTSVILWAILIPILHTAFSI